MKRIWENLYKFLLVFAAEGFVLGGILAIIDHGDVARTTIAECQDPFLASPTTISLVMIGFAATFSLVHAMWLGKKHYTQTQIIGLTLLGALFILSLGFWISGQLALDTNNTVPLCGLNWMQYANIR